MDYDDYDDFDYMDSRDQDYDEPDYGDGSYGDQYDDHDNDDEDYDSGDSYDSFQSRNNRQQVQAQRQLSSTLSESSLDQYQEQGRYDQNSGYDADRQRNMQQYETQNYSTNKTYEPIDQQNDIGEQSQDTDFQRSSNKQEQNNDYTPYNYDNSQEQSSSNIQYNDHPVNNNASGNYGNYNDDSSDNDNENNNNNDDNSDDDYKRSRYDRALQKNQNESNNDNLLGNQTNDDNSRDQQNQNKNNDNDDDNDNDDNDYDDNEDQDDNSNQNDDENKSHHGKHRNKNQNRDHSRRHHNNYQSNHNQGQNYNHRNNMGHQSLSQYQNQTYGSGMVFNHPRQQESPQVDKGWTHQSFRDNNQQYPYQRLKDDEQNQYTGDYSITLGPQRENESLEIRNSNNYSNYKRGSFDRKANDQFYNNSDAENRMLFDNQKGNLNYPRGNFSSQFSEQFQLQPQQQTHPQVSRQNNDSQSLTSNLPNNQRYQQNQDLKNYQLPNMQIPSGGQYLQQRPYPNFQIDDVPYDNMPYFHESYIPTFMPGGYMSNYYPNMYHPLYGYGAGYTYPAMLQGGADVSHITLQGSGPMGRPNQVYNSTYPNTNNRQRYQQEQNRRMIGKQNKTIQDLNKKVALLGQPEKKVETNNKEEADSETIISQNKDRQQQLQDVMQKFRDSKLQQQGNLNIADNSQLKEKEQEAENKEVVLQQQQKSKSFNNIIEELAKEDSKANGNDEFDDIAHQKQKVMDDYVSPTFVRGQRNGLKTKNNLKTQHMIDKSMSNPRSNFIRNYNDQTPNLSMADVLRQSKPQVATSEPLNKNDQNLQPIAKVPTLKGNQNQNTFYGNNVQTQSRTANFKDDKVDTNIKVGTGFPKIPTLGVLAQNNDTRTNHSYQINQNRPAMIKNQVPEIPLPKI